jgi:hypothetical protein
MKASEPKTARLPVPKRENQRSLSAKSSRVQPSCKFADGDCGIFAQFKQLTLNQAELSICGLGPD